MNSLLHKIPFIRLFLPFVLGIFLSILLDINQELHLYLLSCYFILLLFYFILKKSKQNVYNLFFALLLNFFLFAVGIESCYLRNALNETAHYSNQNLTRKTLISGFICDIPQIKEKSIKVKLKINLYKEDNQWKSCSGYVYAYFPRDSKGLLVGKTIVCKNKLTLISEPKNPYEFNYKKYLYYKNIYHQLFLREKDFVVESRISGLPFTEYPLLLKEHLLSILKENNLSDDKLAVTSALLLGYDDEISSELLGAYSRTGTLHVLSVSGLHVGVLFMILNFIIRLPNKRFFVVLKTGIIFCCIWFYALLTGFSPSVVRSATMFSFILIGTAINKKGNIYNTLLASAFIILLFDPFLLIDVGFQLSYLAVGGIVFFYPYVSNWIVSEHKIINVIWKTTAVSISAQIITLPLTLYYFGQFPSLFFIANLLVIPLSYVVMFGSMILVCVSKIKIVAFVFSTIVSWSVIAMNESTLFLDRFKFVNISDVNTSLLEMILFFAITLLITDFFINKRYWSIMTASVIVCFFIGVSISQLFFVKEDKVIVFHAKDFSCVDFYSNKTCNSVITETVITETKFLTPKQNRIKQGIRKINEIKLVNGFYCATRSGKKFGILTGDSLINYQVADLGLDYLLLSNNPYLKGIEQLKLKTLIVDGSNNYKTIRYIQNKKLPNVWLTKDRGAFVLMN